MPYPLEDEGGPDAALRVDHEIEVASGKRATQKLAKSETDPGILDDLVEIGLDERPQGAGIDGLAPPRQPSDARASAKCRGARAGTGAS